MWLLFEFIVVPTAPELMHRGHDGLYCENAEEITLNDLPSSVLKEHTGSSQCLFI